MNMKYNEYTERESLVLEYNDYRHDLKVWDAMLKIFNNGKPAARICIRAPYMIQTYGEPREDGNK